MSSDLKAEFPSEKYNFGTMSFALLSICLFPNFTAKSDAS